MKRRYAAFMFHWLKYTLLIGMGVLVFACSHTDQQDENKTTDKWQHKNGGHPNSIQTLKMRVSVSGITEQIAQTSDAFIYQTRFRKNTGIRVIGDIQNISQRNTALHPGSEPVARQNQYTQVATKQSGKSNWGIRVIFDNDIWNNTDYYYTNGLAIELLTPLAKSSPLNKILLGTKAADVELNGFSIRQNMYTPTNPDVTEILTNDRPFSAFLTIGQFRETWNIEKKLHLTSMLEFGVLGPASLGGTIQSGIHTEEPVGWQNQIQNSLVVSYFLEVEKGIVQTKGFEFNVSGSTTAGTLFNKAGVGFSMRLGRFSPVYGGPLKFTVQHAKNSPLQFWFFTKIHTDFILYNATLQGGMFSTGNTYTISGSDINRLIFRGSAGVAVYLGSLGIELENFFLTPEFKGGKNFGWGRIKLVAAF